jgi:2,3-bisphosphoglycerate-independent phosphoglycerate mutase
MSRPRPVVLTILDGWGNNPSLKGNAVAAAHTPTFDRLLAENPHTLIHTSGPHVGLPKGQMGNSEVGHLNIGSGRIIQMDVSRIDVAIEDGSFFLNPTLKTTMAAGKKSRLHLMGLVSDGGVHSHQTHLYALLEMAKREGVQDVVIHAFIDGRDTPPNSGVGFIRDLLAKIEEIGVGRIGSISGRYYAMDRDKRWERVGRAYAAMALGQGNVAADPVGYLQSQYADKITDEFIEPAVLADSHGLVRSGDAVFFFNYRADRAREISDALTDADLQDVDRTAMPINLQYATMTQYDKNYAFPVAFGPLSHINLLADVLQQHGVTNLRCAETEKYPHVTFFFNGGTEQAYIGEDRRMVASPKVATYDLQPEMSAPGVTQVIVDAIESGKFDVIIVNFANADMVGHTGVFPAAVKACEAVDEGLSKIEAALAGKDFAWIITADHGNSELMIDPVTNGPHTYHTTFQVPLILVNGGTPSLRADGSLRDISPTILGLLQIHKPEEMTGRDLRLLN